MKGYEASGHRVAFGAAAAALTAVTIALAVVAPTAVHVRNDIVVTRAAPPADDGAAALEATLEAIVKRPGAIEADIIPARIEVYAVRKPKVVSGQPRLVSVDCPEHAHS